MASRPVLAAEADLARAWPVVLPPMLTYLAAADWSAPVDPAAAARWLLDGGRIPFYREPGGTPVIAVLERHPLSAMCRLLVLSPRGPELEGAGEVLGDLVRFAIRDLGLRRCEWRVLAGWPVARGAAAGLGFREEGRLPEACFVDGRHDDVVLTGLLAPEWRAS
ncbi:MAG TPA: GNAT family protein [Candidatus Dormibacteraeota bacterium]|jgi:hypothetical protein